MLEVLWVTVVVVFSCWSIFIHIWLIGKAGSQSAECCKSLSLGRLGVDGISRDHKFSLVLLKSMLVKHGASDRMDDVNYASCMYTAWDAAVVD